MYFLVKGRCAVYYGNKKMVSIIEGSYFGEIGCIMGGIRRAPSTHFKDELERNGGIITHVVGAYNETSESVYHTIRHAAHLVADKAARRGTAKEKEAVLSVMTWWYSQNYGCAITKAQAKQTLNAVSFACSSRAAAKHTAKNANLKKTRASYYSGATADAELPFRISAKRAFHNGRPINDD